MSLINSVKYYFKASKFNELGNVYVATRRAGSENVILGVYNDELIAIARALKHAEVASLGDVEARLISEHYAVHRLIVGGEMESTLNPIHASQTPDNLRSIYKAMAE